MKKDIENYFENWSIQMFDDEHLDWFDVTDERGSRALKAAGNYLMINTSEVIRLICDGEEIDYDGEHERKIRGLPKM